MARYRHIQNDFLSGEISPRSYGRTNLEDYGSALKEALNVFIRTSGGAERRSGSIFLKSSYGGVSNNPISSNIRIIPTTEPDLLLVFQDSAIGLDVPSSSNNDAQGAVIYKISLNAFITLTRSFSASNVDAWAGYSANELKDLKFAHAGDFTFIVHHQHQMIVFRSFGGTGTLYDIESYARPIEKQIKAYADTDVNITHKLTPSNPPNESVVWTRYPFQIPNTDASRGFTSFSATTGAITFVTTPDSATVFKGLDYNGMIFKVTHGATTGVIRKGAGDNGTVLSTLGATTATTDYELCIRPRFSAVVFFEQRLFLATVKGEIFASQIGDLVELMQLRFAQDANFDSVTNDRPFSFTPISEKKIIPRWMLPGDRITAGANSHELQFYGPDPALSIGPLNVKTDSRTHFGSENVQALKIENTNVFVQIGGKVLREFYFNESEDAFRAKNLNILADHITDKGLDEYADVINVKFKELHAQAAPDEIIFALDDSGLLHSLTRSREFDIMAWSSQKFGGDLQGESPKVRSLTISRDPGGSTVGAGHDRIFLAVTRTINGSDVTYLEKIDKPFSKYDDTTSILNKMVYLDSAKLVQVASFPAGTPATVFSGFDHLEGQTVSIIADQRYVGEKVVSGGAITLDEAAQEVVAGLSYRSVLSLLDIENGSSLGSSQGAVRRIDQATLRIFKSFGIKIGRDTDNLEELDLRPDDLGISEIVPLFSGDKTIDFQGDYDREFKFVIVQDIPYPMNISSVSLRATAYD